MSQKIESLKKEMGDDAAGKARKVKLEVGPDKGIVSPEDRRHKEIMGMYKWLIGATVVMACANIIYAIVIIYMVFAPASCTPAIVYNTTQQSCPSTD